MGVPGKPLHEKPPVLTEKAAQAEAPPHATRVKPGPEAGYPGASPALVDAGFAATAPGGASGIRGNRQWRQFFDICKRIQGFPRHLSIHVGGCWSPASR